MPAPRSLVPALALATLALTATGSVVAADPVVFVSAFAPGEQGGLGFRGVRFVG